MTEQNTQIVQDLQVMQKKKKELMVELRGYAGKIDSRLQEMEELEKETQLFNERIQ